MHGHSVTKTLTVKKWLAGVQVVENSSNHSPSKKPTWWLRLTKYIPYYGTCVLNHAM